MLILLLLGYVCCEVCTFAVVCFALSRLSAMSVRFFAVCTLLKTVALMTVWLILRINQRHLWWFAVILAISILSLYLAWQFHTVILTRILPDASDLPSSFRMDSAKVAPAPLPTMLHQTAIEQRESEEKQTELADFEVGNTPGGPRLSQLDLAESDTD